MTTAAYPTVDESLDRLHRAGWSVGDTAFGPNHALVWCVTGRNGENQIEARGRSRSEAYWYVCIQAREVGMLAAVEGCDHDDRAGRMNRAGG